MAGSVNKVILIGNVGKDPEVRRLTSGDPVASFCLATSESWSDRNSGERRERTEWHNIVVFNKGLIRVIEQYVQRGSKLYIEGQLQTRKWQDRDGNDRYSTEIVLQPFRSELHILSGRNVNGSSTHSDSSRDYENSNSRRSDNNIDEIDHFNHDLDDEIPF